MTDAEIEQKIKDILVAEVECDPEKLKPETNLFTELDLDSIDAVDLVVRLQQETKPHACGRDEGSVQAS